MLLHTSCDFEFEITVPTPFVLMLRPRSGAQQWISREEYKLTPSVPVFEFTDGYGNLCYGIQYRYGSRSGISWHSG